MTSQESAENGTAFGSAAQLEKAHAAFDQGNYLLARELLTEILIRKGQPRESSHNLRDPHDDALHAEALKLKRRLETPWLTYYILGLALALLLAVTVFAYASSH